MQLKIQDVDSQIQNLDFVVSEENEDAQETIQSLQQKKMEQLKIVQKGRREQKACIREAINNIDDLEIVQKKKIDPLLLKQLILSCKLPVEFP